MDKNEIVRKFNSKEFGEWIMRQKIKGQPSMIIRFLQRTMMCRCGCQQLATKVVISEDFDGPFTEYCCEAAANYLYRCALEIDMPFLCEDLDIQAY